MKSLRPTFRVLMATLAIAWSLPVQAVYPGSCANGKVVYNKTNPGTGAIKSCADGNCHGSGVSNKNIQNGSGNPSAINNALDGTSANAEMLAFNLRVNLPLSTQDIDDLATWIFYAPACPGASLQAAPAPLTFGTTAVGSTSVPIAVTVTNVGAADANGVSLANSNAAEFPVSGSTCTGTLAAGTGTCIFNVAFKPAQAGSRIGSVTVNRSAGAGVIVNVSGTGSSGASPGQLSMSASIAFGNQAVGTTSSVNSMTITNIGGSAVLVSGITSSNPSEFTVTGSTCATVNAGAGCSASLTFKPGAAGARSGSVSVASNGIGSPQGVNVNGTGTTGTSLATVTVVEYHNSDFDHYFITPVLAEIALLDAHTPPFQAWSRTGLSFNGYVNATAPATSVAICRFFNSTFAPKSSHFYAPHGLGCEATITGFPDWTLEDDKLFNSALPDATGACPAGTVPVYRLYNSGMGGAPNHRFVTSLTERQNMINQGFIAEGYGIGVGMCVPP